MSDDTKPGALSPADAAVVERVVKDFGQMVQSASKDFDLEGTRTIASEVICRPLIQPIVALVVAARAETADAEEHLHDALECIATAERAREALVARIDKVMDEQVALGERKSFHREGAFGGTAETITRFGDLCRMRDAVRGVLGV